MDSSFLLTNVVAAVGFFLTTVTAAIGFFTLFRKLRSHQDNKDVDSSSPPPPSPSSSNCIHQVFPSFHGPDVRKGFLSHMLKEFERKGITPFIDNNIKRGESIAPELKRAIQGSKIAIVLLSKNYASSSWCLDELVEIMNCREELGQTVMTVFYKVDPTDVKKLTGDFGKVFIKSSANKKKDIGRWRHALEKVATIAGYHLNNWENESDMIEKITTDISNKLNYSTLSNDFDRVVGMGAHMEKMEQLLCLDLVEARMIGIWGPYGIGKTTIARVLFNQHSQSFDLSAFMENIKTFMYARPACSDDYGLKLLLHQQLMSRIFNQKDIEISHLGVAPDRLKEKRVLVILDDVDRSAELEAMAKEIQWFGPGSRIIITTQDKSLLRAHGIKNIYEVGFPAAKEALQIFCMSAFGHKSPKDGFEELAQEVTKLAGELPLGLRVMGSHFRGMSVQEWTEALPRFKNHLVSDIQSILKFSYDALDDIDKDLFLHIACFFNGEKIETLERCLEKNFADVRQGIRVLTEKSLMSVNREYISMHNLLAILGREIVRKQSIHDPGQRQFLVDAKEFCEVLTDDSGSRGVLGINLLIEIENELDISEKAFVGLSNLQFLRVHGFGGSNRMHLPRDLNYLSRKLRFLHWCYFPMTGLPSDFQAKFLVKLDMPFSNLEKLWNGIQPLRNLRWMDLSHSKYLKELPDLSTATNLQELNLFWCSSLVKLPELGNDTNLQKLCLGCCARLVKLPSSIGNATNLQKLHLHYCLSLVELPDSIGKATNLQGLDLGHCSSLGKLPSSIGNAKSLASLNLRCCSELVELPSSIGNLHELLDLRLEGCSKLEALPTNINLKSLEGLHLTECSLIKSFPACSTSIKLLHLSGTAIEEVTSSIMPRLRELHMSNSENFKEFPHAFASIRRLYLSGKEIKEVPPWFMRFSRLRKLTISYCRKLVSVLHIPNSLKYIHAENCDSLETLHWSAHNSKFAALDFTNCFKLNKEARDLIIRTPTRKFAILPGGEMPLFFTDQAIGNSVTVKLDERPFHATLRFKVCILLAYNDEAAFEKKKRLSACIMDKQNELRVPCTAKVFPSSLNSAFKSHLCIFEVEVEVEVTPRELLFEFDINAGKWEIGECGIMMMRRIRYQTKPMEMIQETMLCGKDSKRIRIRMHAIVRDEADEMPPIVFRYQRKPKAKGSDKASASVSKACDQKDLEE